MDDRSTQEVVYAIGLGIVTWTALAWTFDATEWSKHTHLTIIGGTLELVGIALVAMDFWRPWLTRAGRHARERLTAALGRARIYMDSLGGHHHESLEDEGLSRQAIDEVVVASRKTGYPPVRQTLIEHKARLDALEARQASEFAELRDAIDTVGSAVEQVIEQDRMRYVGWRIVGLLVAFSGTFLLTAANLVTT